MSDIGSELASNLLLSLDKWTNTYFGEKNRRKNKNEGVEIVFETFYFSPNEQ